LPLQRLNYSEGSSYALENTDGAAEIIKAGGLKDPDVDAITQLCF